MRKKALHKFEVTDVSVSPSLIEKNIYFDG